MKSKASIFVLLAEIAAIIILHSAKVTRSTDNDRTISTTTQQSEPIPNSMDKRLFTSLK